MISQRLLLTSRQRDITIAFLAREAAFARRCSTCHPADMVGGVSVSEWLERAIAYEHAVTALYNAEVIDPIQETDTCLYRNNE